MSNPFDLEKAKAGAPVQTRNGRSARIICWDAAIMFHQIVHPIVALVKKSDGLERMHTFTALGKFYGDDSDDDDLDLVMAPVKKRGWINIYPASSDEAVSASGGCGNVYKTKELADEYATFDVRIACIEIEWEE